MLSASDTRVYLSTTTGAINAWDITGQNLSYLGFEDLTGGGDKDYEDVVIGIEIV